jgi:NAD/NADP transhydrogenase alpha subunit
MQVRHLHDDPTVSLYKPSLGAGSQFLDEQYKAAGATLATREEVLAAADILLKVRPPLEGQESQQIKEGSTLISFLYPAQNKQIVDTLASRKVNAFAMDLIPRISRAQVFDALRSGYTINFCTLHFLTRCLKFHGQYRRVQSCVGGF